MPLPRADLREVRFELQASVARLQALRDLVVEVYGADHRAAESFVRAVDNVKHLQQVLARPAVVAAAAPPPAEQRRGNPLILTDWPDLIADDGDDDDSLAPDDADQS